MVVDIDLLVKRLVHLKAPKARMFVYPSYIFFGRFGIKFIICFTNSDQLISYIEKTRNTHGCIWATLPTSQWNVPVQTWILLVLLVFYSSNAPPMEQDWGIHTSWTFIWSCFDFCTRKLKVMHSECIHKNSSIRRTYSGISTKHFLHSYQIVKKYKLIYIYIYLNLLAPNAKSSCIAQL